MNGKLLVHPDNKKLDGSINPIALIKVGLVDPKNGIIAPTEPPMELDRSKKLTTGEKICYVILVLVVVGVLTGIITYRILEESNSNRGRRSLSKRDLSANDPVNVMIDKYLNSLALIKLSLDPTNVNLGPNEYKYCAGLIVDSTRVLSLNSCFKADTNNLTTHIDVYVNLDIKTINAILAGQMTGIEYSKVNVKKIVKANYFNIALIRLEQDAKMASYANQKIEFYDGFGHFGFSMRRLWSFYLNITNTPVADEQKLLIINPFDYYDRSNDRLSHQSLNVLNGLPYFLMNFNEKMYLYGILENDLVTEKMMPIYINERIIDSFGQ